MTEPLDYHGGDPHDARQDARAEHNLEHGEHLSLPEFLRLLLTNRVPDSRRRGTPGRAPLDDISSPPGGARPAHLRLADPPE